MTEPKVRVYDFATKRTTEIPRSELADGYMRTIVEGVGEVYTDPRQGNHSRPPPKPLTVEQLAKISAIEALVGDALPSHGEAWIDGFARDQHPDREIGIWAMIAGAFAREVRDGGEWPHAKRVELVRLLTMLSTNGLDNPTETFTSALLSPAYVRSLADRLRRQADAGGVVDPPPTGPIPTDLTVPKVGRNDPCPCGSGRKYKKCHGA